MQKKRVNSNRVNKVKSKKKQEWSLLFYTAVLYFRLKVDARDGLTASLPPAILQFISQIY